MLLLATAQLTTSGDEVFLRRVDAAMHSQMPKWGLAAEPKRLDFLRQCLARARVHRLTSEQGVVSYVLGAAWLGLDFEQRSSLLLALLAAPLPELRRSHGMNEWVADQLSPAATDESGDEAIRRSFAATEAWGRL